MPRLLARASRLLRLGALMLLVLSIMGQPMVAQLGDIHASEHAVLAADAHHDHDHANHDHADHDTGTNADHTKGPHGLMHQADSVIAAAFLPALGLALAVPPAASPPLPVATSPRLGIPVAPFRPPIA